MAKSDDSSRDKATTKSQPDSQTPPAQHVWLAGLGAMAKAQEQGSKAIEALVNDGLAFQRKSQAEAQQRLHEATERLSHMASDFGQQTSGRVDKLEHLFEDRVAKALHRLGMPTLLDIQILNDRIAQLEAQLAALSGAATRKPASAPAKTKAAAPRKSATATAPTKGAKTTKSAKTAKKSA
ncbi:MAG: phasin family protein [Limnohabitans sp.]|jgi:poly(hydroxyalkanoate) granule-associated protein|uniref:phasin family protein n=1 Tax=Limnohabitans sp. TaxID=1907725 RepID=UPI001B71D72A|nr:phasin family protein [Limnohabitans sp.]MBP6220828.1 phasin family protein [Limnohabitans sp.]MBP6246095.1 phasin family protein [Limnohabitans sp.]